MLTCETTCKFSQDFVTGCVAIKTLTFRSVLSCKLKGTTEPPVKGKACFGALEKNGRASADIHQQVSCLLMVFYVCVVCGITAFLWCP